MPTCTCGDPVQVDGTLCQRCDALRLLGVSTDATWDEIKSAYHILVKVWHPDRFQTDEALTQAAEAKLKAINAAFEFLRSHSGESPRRQPPNSDPATNHRTAPYQAAAEPVADSNIDPPVDLGLVWRSCRSVLPSRRLLFRCAALALLLLLARYIWIAFDFEGSTDENASRIYRVGNDSLLKELQRPKRRFIDALEQDLRRLNPFPSGPAPIAIPPDLEAATPQSRDGAQKLHEKSSSRIGPAASPASRPKILPYITLGSTKAEILDQLGTPTASTGNSLVYGQSELFLKDNAVIGWKIDPSFPLRVKLWPQSPVDPEVDHFDLGSSKDVVLVVQGTPSSFSADKFVYGGSEVYFKDNKVVGWKNNGAVKLHAGLP